VNGGQRLVVNVLGSAANVQDYPDMGVYCYTAHENVLIAALVCFD